MSGIYIPDMEMPKSCGDCKFSFIRHGDSLCESDMFCFLTNKELCLYKNRESINNIKIGDCPLVEVPTHGRLIDADVIGNWLRKQHVFSMPTTCKIDSIINDAPTIIEASKERKK